MRPLCPSPGWQGGGAAGGGRLLTSLPMLSAMAFCQAVMICSESCWMRNSEPSRVFSYRGSGQRSGQGHGAARVWPQPPGFGGQVVAENGTQLITLMTPIVAVCRRAKAAGNLPPVQTPSGKTPLGARMSPGDISMSVGKGQWLAAQHVPLLPVRGCPPVSPPPPPPAHPLHRWWDEPGRCWHRHPPTGHVWTLMGDRCPPPLSPGSPPGHASCWTCPCRPRRGWPRAAPPCAQGWSGCWAAAVGVRGRGWHRWHPPGGDGDTGVLHCGGAAGFPPPERQEWQMTPVGHPCPLPWHPGLSAGPGHGAAAMGWVSWPPAWGQQGPTATVTSWDSPSPAWGPRGSSALGSALVTALCRSGVTRGKESLAGCRVAVPRDRGRSPGVFIREENHQTLLLSPCHGFWGALATLPLHPAPLHLCFPEGPLQTEPCTHVPAVGPAQRPPPLGAWVCPLSFPRCHHRRVLQDPQQLLHPGGGCWVLEGGLGQAPLPPRSPRRAPCAR